MSALRDSRPIVRGQVWLPGKRGFDTARRPWNLAIEQPVDAVLEAAYAADAVPAMTGKIGAALDTAEVTT
ncbi:MULTISPECIES: hypothetical protein [unclassified Micromonospora]|uniref:hypothetical protein n=1 Tax=unclassified Micromonospora TaxID=2617518 RepID=UPI0022B72E7B|nr:MULTISPECIES: hypothetical protein [unclassified Micromonospora]MCZ7421929.1 hypothetical protein [Verrucosispora sp. WMMA2121]WBB93337.1 hypothetical protein O7597_10335 [Verrucosispora sp. WMMC514]